MKTLIISALSAASLLSVGGCDHETSGWVVFPQDESTGALGNQGGENGSGGGNSLETGGTPGFGGDLPEDPHWEEVCSPSVTFQNLDPSDEGIFVEQALGAPTLFIRKAAEDVCRVLYREASEVPAVPEVHLLLHDFDGAGSVSAAEIRLSTSYLWQFSLEGGDTEREAAGMARFLLAHLYQHTGEGAPSWIISGKSDFVRLAAGFLDAEVRAPGGTWTDGFRTTAHFFAHLVRQDADFIYRLNERMAPGEPPYGDSLFEELTGSDLNTLWQSYQASFE